jgi:hypothetical protein
MELNFPYTLSFRVLPTKKVISEKGKRRVKKTMLMNINNYLRKKIEAYMHVHISNQKSEEPTSWIASAGRTTLATQFL